MTYCVGMRLDRGLIFMSDTRTNAGVDDVSKVRKMRHWENTGERAITLLSAGNLATTQSVVSLLDERTKAPSERDPSILSAPSMFQVATIIGNTLREVIANLKGEKQQAAASPFSASLIVGGQIAGSEPRLFLIYPEGNFIEAGDDSPFFPDRRDQVWAPDHRADLRSGHAVRRRRPVADGLFRFHHPVEPGCRSAAGPRRSGA